MHEIHTSCWLEFKSFRDSNGHRPSQTVILHNNGLSWWIKVMADWRLPDPVAGLGLLKGRSVFQQFVEAIDWTHFQLLDNTVTKIILSLDDQKQNSIPIRDGFQTPDNYFIALAHRMGFTVTEDPDRVIYPAYCHQYPHLRQFEAIHLQIIEEEWPTISIIIFEQQKFAYKTINQPLYIREDTQTVLNEIDVLAQLRGEPNVAQLVGVVISENPYKTYPSTEMPAVITGFLMEYYPGGSLEEVLENNDVPDAADPLLLQWALQIGKALETLHRRGRTHLDVKLANILLDAQKNAILIDVSGTGGFGWEWLSPEMEAAIRAHTAFTDTPFETRAGSDSWAYGRVLSILAEEAKKKKGESGTAGGGGGGAAAKLVSVASCLMKMDPKDRFSVGNALAELGK